MALMAARHSASDSSLPPLHAAERGTVGSLGPRGPVDPRAAESGGSLTVLGFGGQQASGGGSRPASSGGGSRPTSSESRQGTPATALRFSLSGRPAQGLQAAHGRGGSALRGAEPASGALPRQGTGLFSGTAAPRGLGSTALPQPAGRTQLQPLSPDAAQDDDEAWEAAAQARRRSGAKPRRRRRRSLASGPDSPTSSQGSPTDPNSPASYDEEDRTWKRSSVSSIFARLRGFSTRTGGGGKVTAQRNQEVLDSHQALWRRSASEERLVARPQVAPGFEDFGSFVQHHRSMQGSKDPPSLEAPILEESGSRSGSKAESSVVQKMSHLTETGSNAEGRQRYNSLYSSIGTSSRGPSKDEAAAAHSKDSAQGSEGPQEEASEVRTLLPEDQAARKYRLDNSVLQHAGPGLMYRRSKDLEDTAGKGQLAPWDAVVEGIDEGDGWIRVFDRYLPTHTNGLRARVLVPMEPDKAAREYRLDNSVLQHQGPGLMWRLSKDLNDVAGEGQFAAWEDVFEGIDEGDGWVRVDDRYLPSHADGLQVLVPLEPDKVARKYRLDNSVLQHTDPGLMWRLGKDLDLIAGEGQWAAWDAVVEGIDEGDGWVRVGDRYLPTHTSGPQVQVLVPVEPDKELVVPSSEVAASEAAPSERLELSFEDCVADFHEAVRCGDVKQVKRLLAGVSSNGQELFRDMPVDVANEEGETAALVAARAGRAELCAALLDGHADPLARDRDPEFFRDGVWPHERRPNAFRSRVLPKPGAERGKTVVYHLRLRGVLEEVLQHIFPMTRVALVRSISTALQLYHEKPPLVVAAQYGSVHLMALLLTHSTVAPPSAMALDSRAPTALSYWSAPKAINTPVLNERVAALLVACTHKEWRCAEVVIAAGVSDVSLGATFDPPGRTALHLAAAAGEVHTVRLLLKASASPTVVSGYGRQPLHDACASGHMAAARALVENGADQLAEVRVGRPGIPWKREEVGLTAQELAQAKGFKELHAYLLQCHKNRGLPTHGY